MIPICLLVGMCAAALLAPSIVATLREWRRRTCTGCWSEAEGSTAPGVAHTCSKRRLNYRAKAKVNQ